MDLRCSLKSTRILFAKYFIDHLFGDMSHSFILIDFVIESEWVYLVRVAEESLDLLDVINIYLILIQIKTQISIQEQASILISKLLSLAKVQVF